MSVVNALIFSVIIDNIKIVHVLFFIVTLATAFLLGYQYDKLKYVSERDPLTGTRNIRNLHKVFRKLQLKANGGSYKIAVFVIDIDDFKYINDNYDHKTGDQVLQLVADLLMDVFNDRNHVIRWGGDEFIVFQLIKEQGDLEMTLNRLKKELVSLFHAMTVDISLSIGYSLYPQNGENLDELVSTADKYMYQNKKCKNEGYYGQDNGC